MKRMELFFCVLLIFLVVTACLSGCGAGYGRINFDENSEEEDTLQMTEKEKEILLTSEPFATGKEWIESGNLSFSQKNGLKRIREMFDYLKKKYPSYDIEIKKYSPATGGLFSAQMHSDTFDLEYEGKEYVAKIFFSEDKEPEFADNFYSYLLREEYDQMVIDLLKDNGYTVQSYTIMDNVVGEKIKENMTVEDVLTLYPDFSRSTHIFIAGEKDMEVADKINQVMQESVLGFKCFLYFMGNDTYESAEKYEESLSKVENGQKKYQSVNLGKLKYRN